MDISGMRVLVTGGSGCIGAEVCEILKDYTPKEIIVIGRKKVQIKNEGTLKYILGDICDFRFMEEHIKNTDILVHLAAKVHSLPRDAREEEEFYNVNTHASEEIFKLAQKHSVKKVVFISTVAVFGDKGDNMVTEDYCCEPISAYGKSKLHAENALIKLCKENKMPATILRLTTVFGKKDVGNIANLIKLLKMGLGVVVSGGNNKKSFVYSKDVASAIIESIKNDITNGETYIISGFNITVRDFLETSRNILSLKFCTISIPLFIIDIVKILNKAVYLKLMALGSTNLYDGSKFCNETGFKSQYTLESGLTDSYNYYDSL